MEELSNFWLQLQSGQLPPVGFWGYFLLALLVMVEGPIATLIGAAAATGGMMEPALVFVAAAVGNLMADCVWYGLGYAGNLRWFERPLRWLGIPEEQLEWLQRQMHQHAGKVLLAAKMSAGLIIPALLAAGLARVPWRRWFFLLFTAECIWTGVLVYAGYYLTGSIAQIEQGVHAVVTTSLLLAVTLTLLWFLRRAVLAQLPMIGLPKE